MYEMDPIQTIWMALDQTHKMMSEKKNHKKKNLWFVSPHCENNLNRLFVYSDTQHNLKNKNRCVRNPIGINLIIHSK